MQRKGVGFEALYDMRAVRVLVDDVKDCYAALGLVHHLWTPMPKEFDDYIAQAQGNNYRSLHTAVIGPGGQAARGADPHARDAPACRARRRGALALQGRARAATAASTRRSRGCARCSTGRTRSATRASSPSSSGRELFEDTIYVLTPQGRVIDLPQGATPVDFAYHVHTELGHRCRGAKVDGAMVPLNTPLANGQQVEIVAAKQGGPSRDWLNPGLGYLHSHGARAKVRQWFNRQNHEDDVAQGRAVVEKELQRHGHDARSSSTSWPRGWASRKLDDFLAEVGRGEIGQQQLQNAIDALEPRAAAVAAEDRAAARCAASRAPARAAAASWSSASTSCSRCPRSAASPRRPIASSASSRAAGA